MGVEIYPGFAAAEVLFNDAGAVIGVATGDMGIGKDGEKRAVSARHGAACQSTRCSRKAFADRCRRVDEKFNLRDGVDPQKYGIGIKELWQIGPAKHKPGLVTSQGLAARLENRRRLVPLPPDQLGEQRRAGGRGLRDPSELREPVAVAVRRVPAFQDTPAHQAAVRRRQAIAYGARAINEGGLQSVPKLSFPGGALIGCSAGFVNLPRIRAPTTR